MPARFISAANFANDAPIQTDMLFGQPFPPEDIQALWHMVPGDYVIYWYLGASRFEVYCVGDEVGAYKATLSSDMRRAIISSEDALVYEKWVALFQELALPETESAFSLRFRR